MKYLDELYSFTKILVCFSALIFFTAFYFLQKDEPIPVVEEKPIVFCGTGYTGKDVTLTEQQMKGKELFEGHCTACHAVQKVKVGPALKHVAKRRDIKWIISFVKNPMRKIKAEKDPYAVALYNQYNQTEMTSFPTLKEEEIKAIVSYLSH